MKEQKSQTTEKETPIQATKFCWFVLFSFVTLMWFDKGGSYLIHGILYTYAYL